jgi:hypothetical protein
MNRQKYFNYIEEKLSTLAYRIEMRGGLNLLELNIHSEHFYLQLFNLLFGWQLENLNNIKSNAAGIDLIDNSNKLIVQVSSTATKQKIESALSKNLSAYKGYTFKFISISKNAAALRTQKYTNPHSIIFVPADDIFDIPQLLRIISGIDFDKLENIYNFIIKELKIEPNPDKIESNLTTIITILSKEDWNQEVIGIETVPYDIDNKIISNELDATKTLIDDYRIHYHRIDKIYVAFDQQGVNKSISVLNGIRTVYVSIAKDVDPDHCFILIIDKVKRKILASSNYKPIPDEELELCVQLLVVDAFIRCKIFKNPQGGADANS